MNGIDAHQAGVRDGYTGDRINQDLLVDPNAGAAYRRGLQEGRTQRVDEELLARAQVGPTGMAAENPAGPRER